MVKRAFDIAASLILLVLLGPVMLLTALIVACAIDRPVLFRQLRPGMNSRLFTLYKFVTMTNARDADGDLLPDAERLTRVGKLLRATSLDELPELLNVLKGDMSLVGPRPLLAEYVDRYSPTQARRHEVRPGITGWAQVNGRNSLSWEEKFDRDVWYVDHHTFGLDIRILFMTVEKVVRRDGISHEGEATMTPFLGNELEVREPQEALA
jgi:sugar transferase EpsL